MKDWELTEESFNLFLHWLSEDRDTAGQKYEVLRHRLIAILEARRCVQAAEVSDEAINRFIKRLPELIETFKGDPLPYILVIARNVQYEIDKKPSVPLPDNLDDLADNHEDPDEEDELIYNCLDSCLGKLDAKSRKLLLDYYRDDNFGKIDFRKRIARRLGIAANALRLRTHRLRNIVHACMNDCLGPDVG